MADIYEDIIQDHRWVQRLLDDIVNSQGDLEARFAQFQIAYTAHERAEEHTFYEPLVRPQTTHEQVLEGYVEHHVTDVLIAELAEQPDTADESWHAKAVVLKEIVDHHIEQEERQLFDAARQAMDIDWAAGAAETFEGEKQRLQAGNARGQQRMRL